MDTDEPIIFSMNFILLKLSLNISKKYFILNFFNFAMSNFTGLNYSND